MNPSSEEFIARYNNLPQALREYLAGGELTSVIKELAQHYQLHVDTEGVLGEATVYMLTGFLTPLAFVDELRKAGIASSVATSISNELNERVFKPLQNTMLGGEPKPLVSVPAPFAPITESSSIPMRAELQISDSPVNSVQIKTGPEMPPGESPEVAIREDSATQYKPPQKPPLIEPSPAAITPAIPPLTKDLKPYASDPYREPVE